jgi:hypothetical protein
MTGPPEGYDFRADAAESTSRIIGSMHPELMDLVQDGAEDGRVAALPGSRVTACPSVPLRELGGVGKAVRLQRTAD